MKFFDPAAFLLLALSTPFVRAGSSDDLEGETTIKQSGVCEVTCEWGANLDRRLRQAPRFLAGRRLGVDLANVKCSYLVDEGTESGSSDDTTLDVELPFPDGWIQVEKEADGTDDVFNFERSFVITDGNKTVAEGSVLIELYVGFVEADDDGGDDQVLLDDQSLTVVCL